MPARPPSTSVIAVARPLLLRYVPTDDIRILALAAFAAILAQAVNVVRIAVLAGLAVQEHPPPGIIQVLPSQNRAPRGFGHLFRPRDQVLQTLWSGSSRYSW